MSKIVKNTTYLTLAFVGQKILAFVYFTLIARFLGTENIGIYTFTLSFTTLFAIFVDMGLSSVLVRECSKVKEKAENFLGNVLAMKTIFAFFTLIALFITINIVEGSETVRHMVYLSAVLMFLDSFILSFWAVFRGFQNLKYEAISVIISQAIVLIIGSFVLYLRLPLYFLIISFICGSIFTFIYSFVLLNKKLNIKPRLIFNKKMIKILLSYAIPFAFLGLFSRFYSNFDTVLLKYLGGENGEEWVDIYSVPYKITFALQFIPSAFSAAIYPAMSEYYVSSKENLKKLFEKSMYLLIIFALPASVGIGLLADQIILRIYKEPFISSILPLQILIAGMVFSFISFPIGALLNASNNQVKNTINMALVLAFNVIGNFILIPRFSYIGASVMALSSQALLFLLSLRYCNKIIDYNKKYLLLVTFKSVIAVVFMAIVVLVLKYYVSTGVGLIFTVINLALLPFVGGLVYFVVLFLIKGFCIKDFKSMFIKNKN